MAGDQQAALFGQACLEPGQGKNTYGTGSFVLLNAGEARRRRHPACSPPSGGASAARTTYALEAAIFVTGAGGAVAARRAAGSSTTPPRPRPWPRSLHSNDDVYFVPALTGLGSPHWDPYARGTMVGLTRGTGRAHMARAALEAIAYQTVDAVEAMAAAGSEPLSELKADGGATANAWLMQFQADVLGVPVVVPEVAETTALGAAYLAGVGSGAWTLDHVRASWRERARYEPRMSGDERAALIGRWREAVERARGWARE